MLSRSYQNNVQLFDVYVYLEEMLLTPLYPNKLILIISCVENLEIKDLQKWQ